MGNVSPSEGHKLFKALPGGVKLGSELMMHPRQKVAEGLPAGVSMDHAPSADKPGDKVSCVITLFFRFNTLYFRLEFG